MNGINPLNANPSIDPADNDILKGAFSFIFKKLMQNVHHKLPAKVISFDRGPPAYATVQPTVMLVGTNGSRIPRAQVAKVPVFEFGGGGFVVSVPLSVGDTGWITACDRDISLYLQSMQDARPNTNRMFNFADGHFIPDKLTSWALDEEDQENLVIQKYDGTVKIALWPNKVKIVSPTTEINSDVEINGNLVVNGQLQVTQEASFEGGMTGSGGGSNSFILTGNLRTIGNIDATGDITPHVPP